MSGYVTDNSNCNDNDAGVNPGTTEIRGNDTDEVCDSIALPALNIPVIFSDLNLEAAMWAGRKGEDGVLAEYLRGPVRKPFIPCNTEKIIRPCLGQILQ